jgi:hypothetical protein
MRLESASTSARDTLKTMERIEQALVGRMEQLAKELDSVRTNCSESNADADAKVGAGPRNFLLGNERR